ncbi:MAG TPA: hypothetical protein VGA16_00765 [Candidatus Limnocylindria bacterium]
MRVWSSLFALGLSFVLFSTAAAAAGSFAVSDVSVQTRDGSPWAEGAPIVLVVKATSPAGLAFPDKALSVVMQTDGERTKCLDVAMKLVSVDSGTATYAGVFYPFRAAAYDGRFAIGESVEDITDIRFTVGTSARATTSVPADADLPVLAPVRFDYGPALDGRALGVVGATAFAALGALAVLIRRRRLVATHSVA